MGTSLIVSTGPVRGANVTRRQPRKMLRGAVRTMVRKTLAKLTAISNADDREYQRSLMLKYDAYLIMGMNNSPDGKAFKRVMDRLKAALDAREGDE